MVFVPKHAIVEAAAPRRIVQRNEAARVHYASTTVRFQGAPHRQLAFIEIGGALMARKLRWNANGLFMKASRIENGRLDLQD